jgi:hypothetical protein
LAQLRADHLGIIALNTGRAKDFTRILALLEAGSVTAEQLAALASRQGLGQAWKRFTSKFLT